MKFKKTAMLTLALASCTAAAHADDLKVGVVSLERCSNESKLGKKEQANFESINKQLSSIIADLESQMQTMVNDFNNPEVMDSLSPEAEEEMKMKFQGLNEDYHRTKQQYMQVMNQAQMQRVQTLTDKAAEASQKVAKEKGLSFVVRDDACFYYNTNQADITADVINVLDKEFDLDQKKQAEVKAASANSESK